MGTHHKPVGMRYRRVKFDVIFCDLSMPGMNGIQFYEALLRVRPATAAKVVFLTGGATTAAGADFLACAPRCAGKSRY